MDTKILGVSGPARNESPDPPALVATKGLDRPRKTKRAKLAPVCALVLPLADPLKLDRATGFLQASRISALSSLKKIKFLQLYRIHPNATACARAVGTTARTIIYHLERDEAFKNAFDEVREELADEIEAKIFEFAKKPQNFMDRIAFVRAFRPERWNPNYKGPIQPERDTKWMKELTEKVNQYR